MLMWLLWIAGAYVLGSVPFGVIIGRSKGVDIREHGSRNIGATNVGRVLGKRLGGLCFLLDLLKGAVPVIGAGLAKGTLGVRPETLAPADMWLWLAVAVAAVAGHMASLFLRFGGGKGVATSFGSLVAMYSLLTLPAIGALVVWYVTLKLTRYVSLASIAAAVSIPLWYVARLMLPGEGDAMQTLAHGSPPLIVTAALAALVAWRHRSNISRLRRGVEPKLGAPVN